MALKPCKECGKEVSTGAPTCPQCGAKHPTRRRNWFVILGLAFIGFVVVSTASRVENGAGANLSTPDAEVTTPKSIALDRVRLDYTWSTSAGGNVMKATFTIVNPTDRAIKDLEVTCTHFAPSGTEIDHNTRTIYERVPPKGTIVVPDFNMGFIHSQATKSACEVTDLALTQ